ncbi:MAG TPA: endonuclease MutS2 [Pseudogracilibacillus sp.]|nr:endonuclease MutS2 [Pseudogracilibacillus sp.]
MNEQTLTKLEYDKIIALVKQEAATSIGKSQAEVIQPSVDMEAIEKLQAETDEAVDILRRNKAIPFSYMEDVTPSLKRSEIGGTLHSSDIVHIAQLIATGRNIKTFIDEIEMELPLLKGVTDEITTLKHLEKEITSKIDEDGNLYDDASPALRGIRQSIQHNESNIRDRLHQLTKTKSKMLSDSIITIRNQRYVLPVKQEYKGSIGGIVHDQSSSGQTLFMEPKAIIELNNQLQQSYVKEEQEIELILQKLTGEIANHTETLAVNQAQIAELDVIHARARTSVHMKATKPILNNEGVIDLKAARHPLLSLDTAVASDIFLGESYHAMVITGPNTGGKTVTLKTIGLIVLMAQSGLQIPASDGGKVACYQRVFADIGDEQSIEQNLSTFSSHMTNIVQIMDKVDEESLVLFDELGAGTDPQEGAALAMSILDKVIAIKATVVATTHYPELKAYGYNKDTVMNASVEFDVASLQPTYRLLMGVPGRSNAFEISERLGLSSETITHAKSYLGLDSKNVENMIVALENTKKSAENKEAEAAETVETAQQLKQDLEKEWHTFQKEKEKMYEKAEEKANKALRKAREEAEIIVEEVRQMKDQSLWKEHEWIEARKMFDEAQPELTEAQDKNTTNKPQKQSTRTIQVGDEIKHQTLNQYGEVVEKKNDKEYIIQVGQMKMTAKKKDLEFVGKKKQEQPEPVTHVVKQASTSNVKPELDLRGERYEDALQKLEKYVDDALMQGYPRVTIIHGKGTGALRKGVEHFIKRTPAIKNHRLGAQGEGGSGVTVLELQ